MAVVQPAYGTWAAMNVTALGIANSATAGWQSDRIDNRTTLADNIELLVEVGYTGAPGSDKALYVYAVPWIWDGSTWHVGADGGTTTLPGGSDAAYTIAAPNNLKLLGALAATATTTTIKGTFSLCPSMLADMPDGWSLVIINFTGQTLTSPAVSYRPITYTVV